MWASAGRERKNAPGRRPPRPGPPGSPPRATRGGCPGRRSPRGRRTPRPAGRTSPSFGSPNVTVTRARTTGPRRGLAVGREPRRQVERADGPPAAPAALMASIAAATAPSPGRARPSRAARRRRCRRRRARRGGDRRRSRPASGASATLSPARRSASRFTRASPCTSAGPPHEPGGTRAPRPSRWRATTKPSPPLLPFPQTTAMRRPRDRAQHALERVGGPAARVLHQEEARHAVVLRRAPVGAAHLLGGDERDHAPRLPRLEAGRAHGAPSPSARTCATARPASWLSETWRRRTPRASPSSAVRPERASAWRLASRPAHLHLAPAHPHREPGAERLQRRLLRGEAGGQVLGRIVAPERVGELRLGEDALEEPVLPALHQAPDPGDLHDVDADPEDQPGSSRSSRPGCEAASADAGADPVEDRPRRGRRCAERHASVPSRNASAATVTVTRVTRSPTASTRTVMRSATRSAAASSGSGARSTRAVSITPSEARASA